MEVKVNIAGQEIDVVVSPEQELEIRRKVEIKMLSDFFIESSKEIRQSADFTEDETNLLVDELHHAYPHIKDVGEAVALDKYFAQVKELADGIVEERTKIYRITVRYEGTFDVLVKARDKDEASEVVDDASYYDLASYVDAEEAEFEIDYVREDSNASEYEIDIDATK